MSLAANYRPANQLSIYGLRIIFLLANFAYQFVPLWLMASTGAGWPVFITFGFFFVFVPLFDAIYGDFPSLLGGKVNDRFFAGMLYIQAFLHFGVFVAAIAVAASGVAPLWASILMVGVIGMVNVQCPVVAHEFGHKTGWLNHQMSNFICAVVGMGYFMPQHVMGHHVAVATPEDTATAKFGQDAYSFIMGSFVAEVRGGVVLEAARLRKRGLPVFSLKNDVVVSYAMVVVIIAAMVFWLGWIALPFILLHHFFAWFTLMLNDYLQHYGMLREMLPNGRREPATDMHSWSTDTPLCNLLVLNVQRHAHHHAQPMLPYQQLEDRPAAPRLPTGYFGMMIVALIPPLWFAMMDPRLVAVAGGRRERIYVGTRGLGRLERLLREYATGRGAQASRTTGSGSTLPA
jgi:alkane 1-monooxygenase